MVTVTNAFINKLKLLNNHKKEDYANFPALKEGSSSHSNYDNYTKHN